VIEDLEHVLARLKLLGVLMHSFAARSAENVGEARPPLLIDLNAHNSATPSKF